MTTSSRFIRTTLLPLSIAIAMLLARPARGEDGVAHVASPTPAAVASVTVPAGAWAVVDGKPIAKDAVEKAAKDLGLPPPFALEVLVENAIIQPRLARDGVPVEAVTKDEIDKAFAEMAAQMKTHHMDLEGQLKRQGVARDVFLETRVRTGVALKKRIERELGDDALRAYFDGHRLELGGQVRARRIVVSTRARGDVEARARAQEILSKAKPDGSNFAALARELSDDPGAALSGGDLDWFARRGVVEEPIARAAFALGKRGLVPEPVRTGRSWDVVFVVGTREVEPVTLDAVKDALKATLLVEKTTALLERWRDEAHVVYAPDAERVRVPGGR